MSANNLAQFIARYSKASAARATIALKAYQQATGTDPEDALADLLADFMHWGLLNGQDFDKELERAKRHFGEEQSGCF